MAIFRDTREQLKGCLRRDLALPQGEVAEAILTAVVFCVNQGYADMTPVLEKYRHLVCPLDGKLHRNTDCDQKVRSSKE